MKSATNFMLIAMVSAMIGWLAPGIFGAEHAQLFGYDVLVSDVIVLVGAIGCVLSLILVAVFVWFAIGDRKKQSALN